MKAKKTSLQTGSQTKVCPVCNRPFANRKKWASRGQWENIVYCSKACAKKGVSS